MTLRDRLRTVLREPLVHFLIAGAVIFAVFSAAPPDAGERRIVLDEGALTRLSNAMSKPITARPAPANCKG